MYSNAKKKLASLPPEYPKEILPVLREAFLLSNKTIIVLDDDPTGTQACYDVMVLTSWEIELLTEELSKKPEILYILTNSRSFTEKVAIELANEIGNNLKIASERSHREVVLISRSDSTLRGHFPAEVDSIAEAMEMKDIVQVIIPAFLEGGRYTIDDVHYLLENENLVPVSDTQFAKDVVFGYQNANLKRWVEEKTNGKIKASDVVSISIEDLRAKNPEFVANKLQKLGSKQICIVNAASYKDLEVFAMSVLLTGKKFLFRSSATFVPISAGLVSSKPFIPQAKEVSSKNGSLIMVGSHVPKSTLQLNYLLEQQTHEPIEINVGELLDDENPESLSMKIIAQTDEWLNNGKDVVLYTSRVLKLGKNAESNLNINAKVSAFLVGILNGISVRPKFIIAKGGITSSDLATKGLIAKKALVLGPIIPGVPVWKMDKNSKFPNIHYVVFPGNVGDEKAIVLVSNLLDA
jgi:uncharacterized protein YgbK (DUF1537 family)